MKSATLHTFKFSAAATLLVFMITCSQRAPQEQAPSQKSFTPPTHAYKFDEEDGQWQMPAKNYASTRFSGLSEINTGNVKNLKVAWTFSTGTVRGHEAAPLVVNNTMYVVTPYPNILYALDLTQGGAVKWKYEPKPASFSQGVACCDVVNRGAAYSNGRIFYNTAQPSTTQKFADRTETAFNPQLSLLYTPSDRVSFTALFTRAFRPATLNELYRSFRVGDVVTFANENLRAERQTGGEAGARFYLFEQRLDSRVTIFWTEITRPIANVTIGVTPGLITRQRQNLGRTRSRGIEIETVARLGRHWTISGGYLLADATVLEFPANAALEGLRIPQVPEHQATFQARYANPSWVTIGVQARAGGQQFDDDQNRFPLGRYFTIDAIASRRLNSNFDVFVAAENLFNQRYLIGRTPVSTIGPPVLVRGGIRFRLRG